MIAQTVRRVGSILLLGRSVVCRRHVDLVRGAPLPQRSLGTLGLELIPLVETPFFREKVFETCVCATVAKERLDRRVPMRQLLFRKPKREIVPQVEIVLVRNRDVSIGCFQDRPVDLLRRSDSSPTSSELRLCPVTRMPGARTEPQS